MSWTCSICCEESTKRVRCPVCNAECCSGCVRRYLTSQPIDAQCMYCHAVWDRDIMERLFPKGFLNGEYKRHREQLLFDQARAILPTLQERAMVVRACKTLEEQKEALRIVFKDIWREVTALEHKKYENQRHIAFIQRTGRILENGWDQIPQPPRPPPEAVEEARIGLIRDIERIEELIVEKRREYERLQTQQIELSDDIRYMKRTGRVLAPGEHRPPLYGGGGGGGGGGGDEEERRSKPRFVRGCPVPDCRGFLGEAGGTGENLCCGVCSAQCCKHCHEHLRGDGCAGGEDGAEKHVCKKEDVETAKLLMKDTRPCPKCFVPIYKIDGCDQMWCTTCHTSFSWNTGQIATGHVHNPHYYEWMRQTRGEVPREPGDVAGGGDGDGNGNGNGAGGGGCAPMVRAHTLMQWIMGTQPIQRPRLGWRRTYYENLPSPYKDLFELHRKQVHIMQEDMAGNGIRISEVAEREKREELLIQYLLNEVTEKLLKSKLHKNEKELQKRRTVYQILQMVIQASNDIYQTTMHQHAQPTEEIVDEMIRQLHMIRRFANHAFFRMESVYDCVPHVIDDDWKLINLTKYLKTSGRENEYTDWKKETANTNANAK